jgi:hypothetical protein
MKLFTAAKFITGLACILTLEAAVPFIGFFLIFNAANDLFTFTTEWEPRNMQTQADRDMDAMLKAMDNDQTNWM